MSDQHPRDDGGPAFPAPYSQNPNGMSLRSWFAGLAMQAIITRRGDVISEDAAEFAYRLADAMLAERRK